MATPHQNRSKAFTAPGKRASDRGRRSARAQGKRTSTANEDEFIYVPAKEPAAGAVDHEKVIFINNDSKKAEFYLMRNTEKSMPTATLWKDFLTYSTDARRAIGSDVFGTTLSDREAQAVNLKANHRIFPTLVTREGFLRSKDNVEASNGANRVEGVFQKSTKGDSGIDHNAGSDGDSATRAEIARHASMLEAKAESASKQAKALRQILEQYKIPDADPREKLYVGKKNMELDGLSYIGESIPLTTEAVTKWCKANEEWVIVIAEMLRREASGLASYVKRAEQRLCGLIRLKVAADRKLLRDIVKYKRWELAVWQMKALPTNFHAKGGACSCLKCAEGDVGDTEPLSKYSLPEEDEFADISIEEAIEDIQKEFNDRIVATPKRTHTEIEENSSGKNTVQEDTEQNDDYAIAPPAKRARVSAEASSTTIRSASEAIPVISDETSLLQPDQVESQPDVPESQAIEEEQGPHHNKE